MCVRLDMVFHELTCSAHPLVFYTGVGHEHKEVEEEQNADDEAHMNEVSIVSGRHWRKVI